MGKSNKRLQTSNTLPLTPLLYINDPQLSIPNVNAISAVIPSTSVLLRSMSINSTINTFNRDPANKETILIIADNLTDDQHDLKFDLSNTCKTATLKRGCNFASINLYLNCPTSPSNLKAWGTNHLDLNITQLSPEETADKVYKWLFKTLSIPETLHLISSAEMLATDTKHFPHYAYCSLSEAKLQPRDAKIQFVAVVTSKPVITPGKTNNEESKKTKAKGKRKTIAKDAADKGQNDNGKESDTISGGTGAKLTWTVADRTGSASFYFIHRSPDSQTTWDWVLSLQPGSRYAFPRMPCVAVTESNSSLVFKAPIRLLGMGFTSTGAVIKGVGKAIGGVGDAVNSKVGKAKEWVAEAEYQERTKTMARESKRAWGTVVWRKSSSPANNEKEKAYDEKDVVKREVKVFDSKGKPLWGDEDSVASADAGSGPYINEKEFV